MKYLKGECLFECAVWNDGRLHIGVVTVDNYEEKKDKAGRSRGIGDDERVQLVFIGNRQIPFTTYRKIPESHIIRVNGRILTPDTPYIGLIGTRFAFKFKGEKLPKELKEKITPDAVKIFN